MRNERRAIMILAGLLCLVFFLPLLNITGVTAGDDVLRVRAGGRGGDEQIFVERIAQIQQNVGYALPADGMDAWVVTSWFRVRFVDDAFDVEITIGAPISNYNWQQRIAEEINRAGSGVYAFVEREGDFSTLHLHGAPAAEGQTAQTRFIVYDLAGRGTIVSQTGIDNSFQNPQNALFHHNDEWHDSITNDIDLGGGRLITLTNPGMATISIVGITGLDFIGGLDFVIYGQYISILFLLILPGLLVALAASGVAFRHILKVTLGSLLCYVFFNMHFAHGLALRQIADVSLFYWLGAIIYALLILLIFVAIRRSGEIPAPENVSPPYSGLQKMIISGIFLGMGLMVSIITTIVIPIGGAPVFRIGFAGIFHNMIAVLFGPFYGAIQRTMADLLNFFINPRITGAFLLPVTMVAFFRGLTIGWLWLKVKRINPKIFSIAYSSVFGAVFIFGLINTLTIYFAPDSAYAAWLAPRPDNLIRNAAAYGLLIAGALGLIPQYLVWKQTRITENDQLYNRFIKLLVAIVLPGVLFNFINTYILLLTVVGPVTRDLGLVYFWIPRLVEEITTSLLAVYLMVIVLEVYEKAMNRRLT